MRGAGCQVTRNGPEEHADGGDGGQDGEQEHGQPQGGHREHPVQPRLIWSSSVSIQCEKYTLRFTLFFIPVHLRFPPWGIIIKILVLTCGEVELDGWHYVSQNATMIIFGLTQDVHTTDNFCGGIFLISWCLCTYLLRLRQNTLTVENFNRQVQNVNNCFMVNKCCTFLKAFKGIYKPKSLRYENFY